MFDAGADGARTMMLVYNLPSRNAIYRRFGGVDGSAYLIGGFGFTALTADDVVFTWAYASDPATAAVSRGSYKDVVVEKVDNAFDWRFEAVHALLKSWCEESGMTPKEAFMPLRWIITGKKATPPLPESLTVLGRERVRTRIRAGLESLKKLPDPPAETATPPSKPEPKTSATPQT